MENLIYNATDWKAGREGGTAWTPARLNNIESGIVNATNQINTINNYAECSTARNVNAKVVSIGNIKTLYTGLIITVRFTDAGTANPTSGNLSLNVSNTGAKTIVDAHTNKTVLTYAYCSNFYNNQVHEFMYDGTYWVWMSRDNNTTYTGATIKTSVAKTGSGTTVTKTIATNTSLNDVVATLLNNDSALESKLTPSAIVINDFFSNIQQDTTINNAYIYQIGNRINFYVDFSISKVVNSNLFSTKYKPAHKDFNIYPIYGSATPYAPTGSVWVHNAGYFRVYGLPVGHYYMSGEYALE